MGTTTTPVQRECGVLVVENSTYNHINMNQNQTLLMIACNVCGIYHYTTTHTLTVRRYTYLYDRTIVLIVLIIVLIIVLLELSLFCCMHRTMCMYLQQNRRLRWVELCSYNQIYDFHIKNLAIASQRIEPNRRRKSSKPPKTSVDLKSNDAKKKFE